MEVHLKLSVQSLKEELFVKMSRPLAIIESE